MVSRRLILSALVALATGAALRADPLLSKSDWIIPIDMDARYSSGENSGATPPEGVAQAIDGDRINTKYLNSSGAGSGLVLIPAAPTEVHSITLVTGNDWGGERDPRTFELWANPSSTITTPANGWGDEDAGWVKVAEGGIVMQYDRNSPYTLFNINVGDTTAYGAYKLIFPRLMGQLCEWEAWRDVFQLNEIEFYVSTDGTGTNVALSSSGATAIAINPRKFSAGGWSRYESAPRCLDGDLNTKFASIGCNNGNVQDGSHSGLNSGFIVTPFAGPTIVTSLQLATANDDSSRDPDSWILYGTNAAIQSKYGSFGDQESWTLIASGSGLNLPEDRGAWGTETAPFTNTTAYKSYKFVVTAHKGSLQSPPIDNAAQYSEIQFFGTVVGPAVGTKLDMTGAISIAIDTDPAPYQKLPGDELREGVAQAFDGNAGTKYLSWGGWGPGPYSPYTGIIVTLPGGAAAVQSMGIVTANDEEARDPASYQLYGTNDTITDPPNSSGANETWTLIVDTTAISLPAARMTRSAIPGFVNTTAYTSYKVIFPTNKNVTVSDGLQLSELQLYTTTDATGTNVALGGAAVGIDADDAVQSSDPASHYEGGDWNEGPGSAFDGDLFTKYLNGNDNWNNARRGGPNSGFIVTPATTTIVNGFRIASPSDDFWRDPTSWTLYGTNASIASTDNSQGDGEPWTQIATGTLTPDTGRFQRGEMVTFANDTAYSSYKMVFPTTREPFTPFTSYMQVSEVDFFVKPCPTPFADADGDADVDQDDFGAFQACYTGTGYSGGLSWICGCLDRGGTGGASDGSIDLSDYMAFMNCWTGPALSWSQALTPDCTP